MIKIILETIRFVLVQVGHFLYGECECHPELNKDGTTIVEHTVFNK